MKTWRLWAAAAAGVAVFVGGLWIGTRLGSGFGAPAGQRLQPTANLLRQVQALAQLVTVQYVVEKVVLMEDVKWYGENRVLLLAQGIVKAGVDLDQLQPSDLSVSGRRVRLRLPPAQITDTYLNDAETRVIERETGLWRVFDKNLEQSARQAALEDIRRAARRNGILRDAEVRAREQLTALFRQLGYEEVEITADQPGA